MSVLPLLLLCAAQSAAQEVELGTVEFAAGPGRGSARFYLIGSEPRVDLSIRNDTVGPLWRRGGIGCVTNWWPVEPVTVDGVTLIRGTVTGCSMEKDVPVSPAQLAEWELRPGLAKHFPFRPFHDFFDEPGESLSALDRWAFCIEWTLPRATPPASTMDFATPDITLAWSRATGPRVFIERDGEFSKSYFDPFALDPYQRGAGPIPLRFGPLRGSAMLRNQDGRPVVDWTLTNPLRTGVRWIPEADADPGNEAEAAWFGPGVTLRGSWSPLSAERGAATPSDWQVSLPSTWPGRGDEDVPLLPASLQLHWDAAHGFDADLKLVGSDEQPTTWEPFARLPLHRETSATFMLGPLAAVASLVQYGGILSLDFVHAGAEPVYWSDFDWEAGFWLQRPGAAPPTEYPRQAPALAVHSGVPIPAEEQEYWMLMPGAEEWSSIGLRDLLEMDGLDFMTALEPAWELMVPIAKPRSDPPAHELDFTPAWLRLRWDPAHGFEASASREWPFQ